MSHFLSLPPPAGVLISGQYLREESIPNGFGSTVSLSSNYIEIHVYLFIYLFVCLFIQLKGVGGVKDLNVIQTQQLM